jgi:choline monooxygenase
MTTDVSGVMRPVATANGLPNDHYVDERIFLEERDAVLYNNWSGVAVASDVPEKGDAKPIGSSKTPAVIAV